MTVEQTAEAVLAHQLLATEIQRQIQEIGIAEVDLVSVLNALRDFLDKAGWEYHAGEWAPRTSIG